MSDQLAIAEAEKILKEYSCLQIKTVDSISEKKTLQQALLTLAKNSDYQMLGVCADQLDAGKTALISYLQALGYTPNLPEQLVNNQIDGAIYIKFNGMKQTYHSDSYQGEYRGVLVSCQSSDPQMVNGTYGHLPLNLFID